eukprot:GHVS01084012.1.p1 GENE.GHVS01084012.1~~GHVS01084012.1.p1  ORF type:complete len:118 (+),score=2.84 GHVS01084012.1:324-677(+)
MGDALSDNASTLWTSVRDSVVDFTTDAATSVKDAASSLEPWQLALVVVGLVIVGIAVVWCLVSCICKGICTCFQKLFCCAITCCCKSCWYVTSCKCCREGKDDSGYRSKKGSKYMGI